MNAFVVREGTSPIVLGMPHVGMDVPEALAPRFNAKGRAIADTDWWIDQLYDGLLADTTVVRATFSRYVIDANRDPSGASLYPGQNTTGVCPTTTFDGDTIYEAGQEPDDDEIAERAATFHAPYHAALSEQIARVQAKHGVCVLYDCHSIRSTIPYLFEGRLPVFNIGTNGGETCDTRIESAVKSVCEKADGFDHAVNGRFKGGWTTRRYGQPNKGVHAVQMELAQRVYMDEAPPWTYRPERAAAVRAHLKEILSRLERLALDGHLPSPI